jgi:ATP-dependent DNA ligase
MMLCKRGTEDDIRRYDGEWLGSRKIDGVRCIAICYDGKAYLSVRNDDRPKGLGRVLNKHYPEVIRDLRGLVGAFDGELQARDFYTTMKRNRTESPARIIHHARNYPAIFYIFDRLVEGLALKDRLLLLNENWAPKEHLQLFPNTSDLKGLWKRAIKNGKESSSRIPNRSTSTVVRTDGSR